jgi:hypothetical protein
MKYKIFGLGMVVFIIFLFFIWLWPKEGIEHLHLKSNNIDSISTYNLSQNFVIYNRSMINQVVSQLQKPTKIKLDNPRGWVHIYTLNFYVKDQSSPIELRIGKHHNEGIVLMANDYDYRGESLDSLIRNINNK